MDTIDMMKQVISSTDKVVQGIDKGQLGLPTPCTEWSVRDVLNHITGGSMMFAVCVEDGTISDEQLGQLMGGDNLGDDFLGAWRTASDRAVKAFGIPGVLDKTVKLPFGEMPAGIALNIAIFDVLTHAADLATSTGQEIDDTELVETALGVGRQMIGPDLRTPGVFGPEVEPPTGATPVQRLLAFAGREV